MAIAMDLGRAATHGAITAAPTISSLTLLSGRCQTLAKDLQTAVEKLAQLNPILTGRAKKSEGKVWVEPGVHHALFRIAECPKECPLIAPLDFKSKLQFLEGLEKHLVDPLTAIQTLHIGSQVFLVELMTFEEPFVCFVVHLSHLVGDAKTLYDLVGQLNALLAHQEVKPLQWDSPARLSLELVPLCKADRERISRWGTLGWLAQKICGPARKSRVSLLSKSAIEKQKLELLSSESKFLSSNDVITAALSRAIKNSKVMNIAVNLRGRKCEENCAGNFWHNVPMAHQAAQDPNAVRALLPKLQYYKDGEVPWTPFAAGRYSFITNWTAFTQHLEVEGLKVECHLVHGNFLRQNPTNVAVVFHASRDALALSHNVPDKNLDATGLLGALLS
ncbi:unnamed protein product [Effrenium voratum]|nr:unnamed protein product [Effrenium voratum]